MAVKTFTTEVLTSADTNTYLANSGLVYVTSATVGTGVSSVTVSSAFSSTYDSYKIVISGMSTSVSAPIIRVQLSGITTGVYYSSMVYQLATSSTVNGYNENVVTYFAAAIGGSNNHRSEIDLFGINGSTGKMGNVKFSNFDVSASYGGNTYIVSTSSATATGFVVSSSSGTLSNGTITVYGYRKA